MQTFISVNYTVVFLLTEADELKLPPCDGVTELNGFPPILLLKNIKAFLLYFPLVGSTAVGRFGGCMSDGLPPPPFERTPET